MPIYYLKTCIKIVAFAAQLSNLITELLEKRMT
jgi:hypothetical protein